MSSKSSFCRAGPQRGRKMIFFALVLTLALPAARGAAPRLFPFEDRNSNGIFDDGDREITAELSTGLFESEFSVVIPKNSCGMGLNDGVDQPFDITGTRFQNFGDDDWKNW